MDFGVDLGKGDDMTVFSKFVIPAGTRDALEKTPPLLVASMTITSVNHKLLDEFVRDEQERQRIAAERGSVMPVAAAPTTPPPPKGKR